MEWFSNNQGKLLDAAYKGNLKDVQRLVEKKGVEIQSCRDIIGSTPLHFACGQGHLEVVKYFVEQHKIRHGIKNDEGQTPLDLARENNQKRVADYLKRLPLEYQKPSSKRERSTSEPAKFSALSPFVNGNHSFQRKGSNLSGRSGRSSQGKPAPKDPTMQTKDSRRHRNVYSDETALRDAAAFGNLSEVTNLLKKGVNINCPDAIGTTPLHMACAEGHLSVVKLLQAQGANLNATNRTGQTPLDIARLCNQRNVVEFLSTVSSDLRQSIQMPQHLARQSSRSLQPGDINSQNAAYSPTGLGTRAPAGAHAESVGPLAALAVPPVATATIVTEESQPTPIVSACIVSEDPLIDTLSYKDQGRELRDVLRQDYSRSVTQSESFVQSMSSAAAATGFSNQEDNGQFSSHSVHSGSGFSGSTIAGRIARCESELGINPGNGAGAVQRLSVLEDSLFGQEQRGAVWKRLQKLEEELMI